MPIIQSTVLICRLRSVSKTISQKYPHAFLVICFGLLFNKYIKAYFGDTLLNNCSKDSQITHTHDSFSRKFNVLKGQFNIKDKVFPEYT